MPKALKVRDDNIFVIVNYAKERGFDLSYIRDAYEDATEDGFEFYVMTDGTPEENNVTFTEFYGSDLGVLWKFKNKEQPYSFEEVERI